VCPVEARFGRSAYLVPRYADVREVLADSNRFSNAIVIPFALTSGGEVSEEEVARQRAGNLLAWDPPEHTRLRRLLTPAFVGEGCVSCSLASSRSSRATWTRSRRPDRRPTW
jgi:cytochrome P450